MENAHQNNIEILKYWYGRPTSHLTIHRYLCHIERFIQAFYKRQGSEMVRR